MKATAIAPSNIAFIKYWGQKDSLLRLPLNNSISMNLSNLLTTTTVEFSSEYKTDQIIVNNAVDEKINNRVIKHMNLIRQLAKSSEKAKVVSNNNFPISTGLSSSASSFAALTVAVTKALGLNLTEKELTILTRQGSGSACRSIPDGFTEWKAADTSEESYAHSLYPVNFWEIEDIVVVVSKEKKKVATSNGQKIAHSSPFLIPRLKIIDKKISLLKNFLANKNFEKFGELCEQEALELHAIMLTSVPSLIYWLPMTVHLMKLVRQWRFEGLPVYFTVNTGQDIHLLCESKNTDAVLRKINSVEGILKTIVNKPAKGARLIENHLF